MNKGLLQEIVKHIISNLGVIPSNFVNKDKTQSIMDKNFFVKDKISFQDENGEVYKNPMWSCEFNQADFSFKILLADCSEDKNIPEFAAIIQPSGAPAYGLYYIYTDLVNNTIDNEAMLACLIGDSGWVQCDAFMQANFLSGMERLKLINAVWKKSENYQQEYNNLLSFIKYHESIFSE